MATDTFDLSNQTISEEVSNAMLTVFKENPSARYMNFMCSNIAERSESLAKVLLCPRLRLYSLNLAYCKLGGEIGQSKPAFLQLTQALANMARPLSELSLMANELTIEDVRQLSPFLSTNRSLRLLDLSANPKLGNDSVAVLSSALAQAEHPLQSLAISGIGMTDAGHEALASLVLHENFKCEFLDVSWNPLAAGIDITPCHVAYVLGRVKCVRELHIMSMRLGLNGINQLAKGLSERSAENMLEVLHISSNYVPETSVEAYHTLLRAAPKLKWLDMLSNTLNSNWVKGIAPALNASQVQIVSTQNGGGGDDAALVWASIIAENTSLLDLQLNFNFMTDVGAAAIAAALPKNNTLLYLRLDANEITQAGARAIIDALHKNDSIIYVDLSDNDFDANEFIGATTYPNAPNRIVKLFEESN